MGIENDKKILVVVLTHNGYFPLFPKVWGRVKSLIIPDGYNVDFVAVSDSINEVPQTLEKYINKNGINFKSVQISLDGFVDDGTTHDLSDFTQEQVFRVVNTRNYYRHIAISGNYDYLLQIDGDILPPTNALIKLLAEDKPIITGWAYNKKHGGVIAFPNKIGAGEVYETFRQGSYCLLEKREVFSNIGYSFWGGKSMQVDDEKRAYDIRMAGYSVFLHPGVFCEHLLNNGLVYEPTTDKVMITNRQTFLTGFKNRYTEQTLEKINETTFKFSQKDTMSAVIGDEKSSEFKPHLKFCKWETGLEIEYLDDGGIQKEENGVLKWIKNDKEIHFYEKKPEFIGFEKWYEPYVINREGGLELDLILKTKPESNIFDFKVKHDDLVFDYQPFLTETERYRMDIMGEISRPPEIEGSYAVYHKEKRGGGYKTGKFCHIYRPKIYDANNNWVWGTLNFNEDSKILSITIPQNFLETAIYPVRIDPNFGYETNGGSYATLMDNIRGSLFTGADGTGTSISAYVYGTVPLNIKYALYNSSHNYVTNGTTDESTILLSADWETLNFTSAPTISATDYVICAWAYSSAYVNGYIAYDVGSSNQGHNQSLTYGTWPSSATFTHSTDKYSIYCTYTTGSTSSPSIESDLVIYN